MDGINSTGTRGAGGARLYNMGDISAPRFAQAQIRTNGRENAALRSNASLPDELWKHLDQTIVDVRRRSKGMYNYIRDRGLTTSVPMESEVIYWHKVKSRGQAHINMQPEVEEDETSATYTRTGTVLPIIMDQFSLSTMRENPVPGKEMNFTRDDIEDYLVENSTENMLNTIENMIFNGAPGVGTVEGMEVDGLLTHPDRNTGTLSDWNADTGTIRSDVRNMIQDLKDDEFRPDSTEYVLWVSANLEDALNDADPEGTGDFLVRDRLENHAEIGGGDNIRVSYYMPDDTALLMKPTSNVMDLAIGEDIQTIQWSDDLGFRDSWFMFGCMTPRIKSTMDGQCGIAHYTR